MPASADWRVSLTPQGGAISADASEIVSLVTASSAPTPHTPEWTRTVVAASRVE
jgi:hypothetical protein